jgi:hypothetical protein
MEHNEPQEKTFKERILKRIEAPDFKVYSRTRFVLQMIALIVVAVLILLISIFLFNYIYFSLQISGRAALLHFGPPGIIPFLIFFPWPVLLLDILFVFVLQKLLRRFRFGYHIPILRLLFVIFIITTASGYLLAKTSFNNMLLQKANENNLPPPFGVLFKNAKLPPPDSCQCEITSINGNTLNAFDVNANTTTSLTVIFPANYSGLTSFKVGQIIFVAGARTASNTIQAFGGGPLPF